MMQFIDDMESATKVNISQSVDDAKLDIEKIKHLPHDTLAQKKKWCGLILDYYNQESNDEDDDRNDANYMEGLRDGYSRALNDLFDLGN